MNRLAVIKVGVGGQDVAVETDCVEALFELKLAILLDKLRAEVAAVLDDDAHYLLRRICRQNSVECMIAGVERGALHLVWVSLTVLYSTLKRWFQFFR